MHRCLDIPAILTLEAESPYRCDQNHSLNYFVFGLFYAIVMKFICNHGKWIRLELFLCNCCNPQCAIQVFASAPNNNIDDQDHSMFGSCDVLRHHRVHAKGVLSKRCPVDKEIKVKSIPRKCFLILAFFLWILIFKTSFILLLLIVMPES